MFESRAAESNADSYQRYTTVYSSCLFQLLPRFKKYILDVKSQSREGHFSGVLSSLSGSLCLV